MYKYYRTYQTNVWTFDRYPFLWLNENIFPVSKRNTKTMQWFDTATDYIICNIFLEKNLNNFFFSNNEPAAGFGDVNISAILNSFQMGYDKRVRPNYGGK